MIIKSFAAESSSAALKLVRREMGGDAIVLKTRHLSDSAGGPRIEVTACLEKPSVAQSSVLLAGENERAMSAPAKTSSADLPRKHDSRLEKTDKINRPGQADRLRHTEKSTRNDNTVKLNRSVHDSDLGSKINAIDLKLDQLIVQGGLDRRSSYLSPAFSSIADSLSLADFSRDFISSFIKSLEENFAFDGKVHAAAHRHLVTRLAELMTPTMQFKAGDALLFMGPAGSGKTSLMGKLAVRLVAQGGMKVRLASLDDQKLAAQDELQSFAEFLQVDATELDRTSPLDRTDNGMITLIDTPALPNDSSRFEQLRVDIDRLNPSHRFAVFSALTRSSDTIDIAQRMTALAPTDLIVTMLDLTQRYGSIIAAAEASGKKIAFMTDAPGGIGEANVPDPDRVARTVLNTEAANEPTENI